MEAKVGRIMLNLMFLGGQKLRPYIPMAKARGLRARSIRRQGHARMAQVQEIEETEKRIGDLSMDGLPQRNL